MGYTPNSIFWILTFFLILRIYLIVSIFWKLMENALQPKPNICSQCSRRFRLHRKRQLPLATIQCQPILTFSSPCFWSLFHRMLIQSNECLYKLTTYLFIHNHYNFISYHYLYTCIHVIPYLNHRRPAYSMPNICLSKSLPNIRAYKAYRYSINIIALRY